MLSYKQHIKIATNKALTTYRFSSLLSKLQWRIMLNGFGYALFGVPSRDLETTWHDVTEITKKAAGQSPLLGERPIQTVATAVSIQWLLISEMVLNVLIRILSFYRKVDCCRAKSPNGASPKLVCTPEEESYISYGGRKLSWKSKSL